MIPSVSTPTDYALLRSLQKAADESPYRIAAMACGFTIGSVYMVHDSARIDFTCICGRKETFGYAMPFYFGYEKHGEPVDMVEMLYNFGSFRARHLIEEGYDEEFARRTEHLFDVVLNAVKNDRAPPRRHDPYACGWPA